MLPSSSTSKTMSTMMMMSTHCRRQQQQYHQQQQHQENDLHHRCRRRRRPMATFYGPNRWLWTAVLFGLLIVTVSAKDENSLKPSPASTLSSSQSPRDEIYIDDEGLDGSGHGGPHDDLEKDHDFSGSGFGPDDEDSDSDYHHHSHTHTQTGKSNINKQIDDNDFITTSRNNNQNSHHQTSSGTNIGSGISNTGIISSVGSGSAGGSNTIAGGINTQGGTNIHDLDTNSINSLQPETKVIEQTTGNEVLIMNANDDDRTASFFAQPGILAAVIGGAVVGLLCAILVVMFIVYRMRKKDEGSYALDEPKRSPAMNSYAKNATNREFFA
ncbi:syndecan isoform X3 [Musca domestica]|uniref:Syndecan n=1 Tax=Musca domestica TaxID=7370 RepID=A0ABM3V7I2_MUSDO|nr:syndecan isoform X3 [Musca domestica]